MLPGLGFSDHQLAYGRTCRGPTAGHHGAAKIDAAGVAVRLGEAAAIAAVNLAGHRAAAHQGGERTSGRFTAIEFSAAWLLADFSPCWSVDAL